MRIQNLFTNGFQSKSAVVSAERRLNVYIDKTPNSKGQYAVYGRPGLTQFTNIGASACRGMIAANNVLYAVLGTGIYSISPAGVSTKIGTLASSSGYVGMSDNSLQLLIVDGTTTGVIVTYATSVVSTVTLPAAATSCDFLTGFFIINAVNTGKFYISAAYDGTTWNALQFATAESKPDNLVAVTVESGILMLWGQTTVEFWSNIGANPFPFAPMTGTTLDYGLASAYGYAEVDNTFIFLGTNEQGNYSILMTNAGGQAKKISNSDIDNKISSLTTITNAVAFSWSIDGHPMWQCTWPTDSYTLVYDASNGEFYEFQTGTSRHTGDLGAVFNGKNIVSDYSTGILYYIDPLNYTDNGTYITKLLQTQHIIADFNRLTISELYIDMETGVGLQSGQGSDPQVMLQVSKDGGRTWGNERWQGFGKVGQYLTRVIWRRLGQSRDWVFRFKVTDPVKFVIAAGAYSFKAGKDD